MNLLEKNDKQEDIKTKKIMKAIIITIVVLLLISMGLFVAIYYLQGKEIRFTVDNKNVQISQDLFIFDEDKLYISLKDIAEIVGYKYYNGGYKQYSEETSSCYLEGLEEVCTFEKDSNKIYKTPVDNLDYELFNINEPVKMINNKLYISSNGLGVACNLSISYTTNRIQIYTLPYLTKTCINKNKNAAIADNFKNQKAILYNLLVVQNISNTEVDYNPKNVRYGVTTLDGTEIVGNKYTKIEFVESTKEFIVTTDENKVGIITETGETKVRPQYDALKQIDKDLNLYLVTNNNKQGVIEKNGKILIYLEYEQIGVDTTQYATNNIKNPYLLFDNAIPVKQNGKWGLYDKRGNIILPIEYDGIGCIASNQNLNNVLIIPEAEGIVISKEYELEPGKKTSYYGIVDSQGKALVWPVALQTVYSVTSNGREEYTMLDKNGKAYDVMEYINYNKENANKK